MKVLLDTCVWGEAVEDLRSAGHDAIGTGEWASDPGDEEILEFARFEGRVLVTLDKDFGEMAVLHGARHCGILRLVNIGARQQGAVAVDVLSKHGDELMAGAIITAQPGHLRIRLAELESEAGDVPDDEARN